MIRKLASYTKGYRIWIILGILCSAGEAVLELLLPKAMSQIVDVGIANGDKEYILAMGLKMILMALASLVMGDQEYLAQLQADGQGHDQGGDQHYRGPDQHAHAHHQGHLHRRNVVGEPGDQGCGGKMLNVGKGEPLHLGIFRGADVGAEAHTGPHDS